MEKEKGKLKKAQFRSYSKEKLKLSEIELKMLFVFENNIPCEFVWNEQKLSLPRINYKLCVIASVQLD